MLLKLIIDDGILPRRTGVILVIALVAAGLAVTDAAARLAQRWSAGRIGQGLTFDLRSQVFSHVQRRPRVPLVALAAVTGGRDHHPGVHRAGRQRPAGSAHRGGADRGRAARAIPHEYLLFPDEGHGLVRPANRRLLHARVERFLACHLGGRHEP